MMKPWLRLTLVTVTVGGGFTGVALLLQLLFSSSDQTAAHYVLMVGFLLLYAFVTTSGLIFVQSPERTSPLVAALALQVPWISSPLIAYRFVAGFQVGAVIVGGRFSWGFRLGSDFQINFLQPLPWGVGINFFALALLVLVLVSTRVPDKALVATTDPPSS